MQKTMKKSIIFATIFVLTLIVATQAFAAVIPGKPASVVPTTPISTSSLSFTWTVSTNTSTNYIIGTSTVSGLAGFVTSSLGSAATSTTIVGLLPNKQYWFEVAGQNVSGTSAFATTSPGIYTLAITPAAPTTWPTSNAIIIEIDPGTNPVSTTFAIYNVTADHFIDYAGNATNTGVYYTTSTWLSFSGFPPTEDGLVANTGYQYSLIAKNGDGVKTATSTASAMLYTPASPLSSVSATANSQNEITVSWVSDATDYTAINVTNSVSSGFITGSSHRFTGLDCGTTYSFAIAGRNYDELDTDTVTVSATTHSCGGAYVPPAPPTSANSNSVSARINGANAILTLSASDATQMAVSENASFSGSAWETYGTSKTFALSAGAGTKIIYVKFRYSNGAESSVYTANVNKTDSSGVTADVSSGTFAINSTQGEVIKINAAGRPAVYYVTGGKKYSFVNRGTYTAWSSDVGDTSNKFSTLKSISQDEFDNLLFGGNLTVKPGNLVKFTDSSAVYGVGSDAKLYQLVDVAAQTAIYGSLAPIVVQGICRADYYNSGNSVDTLTASSVKPN